MYWKFLQYLINNFRDKNEGKIVLKPAYRSAGTPDKRLETISKLFSGQASQRDSKQGFSPGRNFSANFGYSYSKQSYSPGDKIDR